MAVEIINLGFPEGHEWRLVRRYEDGVEVRIGGRQARVVEVIASRTGDLGVPVPTVIATIAMESGWAAEVVN